MGRLPEGFAGNLAHELFGGLADNHEFWLAAILAGALILAPDKAGPWTMALGTAFIIWIGFVAPSFIVYLLMARLKWWAILGIVLHWLVVMLVQTVAMKAIGLQAPPDGNSP